MIINLDQIKELLNSDITGYRIGQETSVKQQNYDRYKKGLSNFESMPLKTAIELQKFINKDNTEMKLKQRIIEELESLDEELQSKQWDVYLEDSETLWFEPRGQGYTGDNSLDYKLIAYIDNREITFK